MKIERDPPSDAAVVQRLSALKRQGGSVLVVGALSAAHADICASFLGEDPDEQVLVRTDGVARTDGDAGAEAATVIERPIYTRGGSAAETTSPRPTDLRELLEELRATVRDSPDDSNLRVCFDSLRPFVDGTDEQSLRAEIVAVGEAARDVGAIVHFHLPAMPPSVPAGLFEAVDAVAEASRRDDGTYQRWHFPGMDYTTDWLAI